MKKVICVLLAWAMCILSAGCAMQEVSEKTDDLIIVEEPQKEIQKDSAKGEKTPEEGTSEAEEEKQTHPRTIDISSGLKDWYNFEYEFDMDFDGKKERIELFVDDDYETMPNTLYVAVGSYTRGIQIIDGVIEKVYICDLDTTDNRRELAIFTNEVSNDPILRIFKFENGLTPVEFRKDFLDGSFIVDGELYTGYAFNYYCHVNDDDTLVIEEQTRSHGMWSVRRIYHNVDGVYREIHADTYPVEEFFMKNHDTSHMLPEEREMWAKGYIKAHTDFAGLGVDLYEGDYFKVTMDDEKDNVYIEKTSGEKGWINVADFNQNFELNNDFFYLAG